MVKTPRTRHSKSTKEPVTIDLAPGEISRAKAEAEKTAGEPARTEAVKVPEPETVTPPKTENSAAKPSPDAPKTTSASPADRGADQGFGRKETPPPAAPPAPPRRSGSLLAGVAGGAIALLLAGGLQYAGLLPNAGGVPQQSDAAPAIAALETEIASLREQVAAAATAGPDDGGVAGRLSEAESAMSSLATEFDGLREEVAGLGQRVDGDAPAFDPAPLEQRLAALEAAAGSQADAAAVQQADEKIAALQTTQADAEARLATLERRLGELSGRVDEAAERPATAIIISASALKAAIDRGTPFMTELETYASLAPDAPETAQLRELAASGVPTRARIAAESDAAATAMIAAARPVDPDASIIDRLRSSAMGLVQVRPIGMVEGQDVPAITARIDAAIQTGDYERAIAEFEALPQDAKAAGESFMAKVRARHAADTLVDQALAAALNN